ncbi:MAG TPA: DUF1801 domain-containing protein, partial [Longimicrobium sp.]|nr:DUF1801 domain-containing protein [Longimicrobium sp.]
APFPPEVRALADEARRLVKDAVPSVEERAYPGWKGIGYRDAQAGYVCGVFPQPGAVRLLFEHGHALPDPDGLLEGDGRQVRWVVLRPGEPLPADGVRRLIDAALLHGSVR